jgi:hypothetical protein
MSAERCPTCGGAVEVVTADEGTSSYRPLLTDEMVERAADALWDQRVAEARAALEAALDLRATSEDGP